MTHRITALLMIALGLAACSERGVNPCELLTLEEVQTLAPDAAVSEWHPAATSNSKDNEACVWHDGGKDNVFMLFYFTSAAAIPENIVASGMSGTEGRIIPVAGVGDSATAGFSKSKAEEYGALKMFAARANGHTIGIRVKGIDSEDDTGFQRLKELANSALSRL